MAKLLRRNERRVRGSLKRLVAMGLVQVEHRPGKPTSYSPVINPDFAHANPSIVWFVDAYSKPAQPPGRPKNSLDATVRPLPENPRTDEARLNESRAESPGRMCLKPRTEQSTNTTTDTTLLTSSKNIHMELCNVALAPVMQGEIISPAEIPPDALQRLSKLRSSWKVNHRSSAIEAEETVRLLRRQLAAVGLFIKESMKSGGFVIQDSAVRSILVAALDQTMGTCEGARLLSSKGGNFESYFAASFRAKAASAAKDFIAIGGQARIAAAKVRIEEQAGEKKLGALARKIDATQQALRDPNESERDRTRRMMRAAVAEDRSKSLQGRALNEALAAGGSDHVVTHFLEPLLNSDLPWSKEKVAAWCLELSKAPETIAASAEMLEWGVESLKKRGTWIPVSGII